MTSNRRPSPPPPTGGAAVAASAADRDEDLEIVGSRARTRSTISRTARELRPCPFALEPARTARTATAVCDAPASARTTWARHCRRRTPRCSGAGARGGQRRRAPPPAPPPRPLRPAARGWHGGRRSGRRGGRPGAAAAAIIAALHWAGAGGAGVHRVGARRVGRARAARRGRPAPARFRTAAPLPAASLGFGLERRAARRRRAAPRQAAGGFLCDEMGMGKTAVSSRSSSPTRAPHRRAVTTTIS